MYKSWMQYTSRKYREEAGEFGDTGGGMGADELSAAVDDIGSALGFNDDDEGEGTANSEEDDNDKAIDKALAEKPAAEKAPSEETKPDAEKLTGEPAKTMVIGDMQTPPSTWRKEAAETWAALPETAKLEVLKREQDMMAGIEQYKGDAAVGKTLQNVVAPYREIMQVNNVNPVEHIGALLDTHHKLVTGSPAQRTALFTQIAASYGIEFGGQTNAADDTPGSYVDPETAKLQAEINEIKWAQQQQVQQAAQRERQTLLTTLEAQVNEFAAKPENIHFDVVATDIGNLLKSGVARNLKEAYEKAVWANPTTRALETQRLQAEAAEKAKKEALAKTTQIKKSTSANVVTKSRDGSRTAPIGSIDDTMNEIAAQMFKS